MTLKEEFHKKFVYIDYMGDHIEANVEDLWDWIEQQIKQVRIDELHKLRQMFNPYQMNVHDLERAKAESRLMQTLQLRIKELEGVE